MANLQALRPLVDTSFKTKVVGGDCAGEWHKKNRGYQHLTPDARYPHRARSEATSRSKCCGLKLYLTSVLKTSTILTASGLKLPYILDLFFPRSAGAARQSMAE